MPLRAFADDHGVRVMPVNYLQKFTDFGTRPSSLRAILDLTVGELPMIRLAVTVIGLCTLLSACKIQIEVPSSGAISTESGAISCPASSRCVVDVSDIYFNEVFHADAASGFEFLGWHPRHRSLCSGSAAPCPLSTQSFADNDGLMALLEDPDEVFYLDPVFQSTGFNALMIGHSFFRPFAVGMSAHAERAGIDAHEQTVVFSGGATGAPEALWENASKGDMIRAALDEGDVDLFAMTYHPDYPTLRGYQLWIDYALQNNPGVRIAIALPWTPYPASITTAVDESTWVSGLEGQFHAGIRQLRREYPDTEIFSIPYGQSAWELRKLFDAGQLPDVEVLQSRDRPAIYRDDLGHAREILVELGQLVWLRSIYGVDLDTYDYEPPYQADLKALAQRITDDYTTQYEAVYDAPYR